MSETGQEPLEFEWDEAKSTGNLEKHGIDFLHAALVFGGTVLTVRSRHPAEERYLATGMVDRRQVTVVFTWRGGRIRIISARSARDDERRRYEAHILGRDPPAG